MSKKIDKWKYGNGYRTRSVCKTCEESFFHAASKKFARCPYCRKVRPRKLVDKVTMETAPHWFCPICGKKKSSGDAQICGDCYNAFYYKYIATGRRALAAARTLSIEAKRLIFVDPSDYEYQGDPATDDTPISTTQPPGAQ